MADLFSVTAPLAIRLANGSRLIMIERLAYQKGILFLPPFWMDRPANEVLAFAPGPVKGEGPWKVGDAVVTVLGCHGTDAELASEFAAWRAYLEQSDGGYPAREEIQAYMQTNANLAIRL